MKQRLADESVHLASRPGAGQPLSELSGQVLWSYAILMPIICLQVNHICLSYVTSLVPARLLGL